MKTGKLIHSVLLATAFAMVAGCAGNSPVATTPTGDQASAPQRQVLSTNEEVKVDASIDNMIKQLPAKISAEDAKTMLIEIDPDKVKDDNKGYSVQWRGRYGGYRGYGGWRGYGGFRYLGYGGRFWPYYGYGGYYYPYAYGGYYPYLYGYGGLGLYGASYYYNPFLYNRLSWPYYYGSAYRWGW